ncbi:tetratricopeptide repeat-containing sensor histidine kinase [Fulvivirgaceae bacterium BMA12]|uniref:histidine kinase n=1 Tax=Agaribacillus aureus TaxID=3051825 RepID=A0ABT8LHA9_9BACT|nr:tetratricopeptide repeat-containing sensor histidine kinase [Fulvivirgaceae bacterium BMA12]
MKKNQIHRIFQIFIILLLAGVTAAAQTSEIDSLKSVYQTKKLTGQEKADLSIKLGKKFFYHDLDSSAIYGETALKLSREIDYMKGIAESSFLLGRYYNATNKPQTAIAHLKSAENLFIHLNAYDRLGSLYNNLGIMYKADGNFREALNYYKQSLNNYVKANHKYGESAAQINIGIIYYRTGNYAKATEFYISAIKSKEEIGDMHGVALTNANLGNLFRDQNENQKSLEYFLKAKTIFETISAPLDLAKIHNGLGSIYQALDRNEEALESYQQALKYFQSVNNKLEIAHGLSNIGKLYFEANQLDTAYASQKKALVNYQEIGNRDGEALALCYLGLINIKRNNLQKARENLLGSLEIATDIGDKQTMLSCYNGLYEYYKVTDNLKESHEYFVKYSFLKDEIFNIEKTRQIASLEKQFNIEKQQKENAVLRENQKANQAIIAKQNFEKKVLIAAIVLFFLFTVYYYRVYQQKKKTNELLSSQNEEINKKQAQIISINESLTSSQKQLHQANRELQRLNTGLESTVKDRTAALEEINQELDTFLYQSSHALRRPVVSVMGLTQLARMERTKLGVTQLYDKIEDTLVRMDLMLKKLVMASEINFIDVAQERINFKEIINKIKVQLVEKLNIDMPLFSFEIAPDLNYFADKRLITVVFQNLIENAMLYHNDGSKRQPSIHVKVVKNDPGIHIRIHDNGIGISEKVISHVFNMFTVGNDRAQGYGLGLYLVKKAVEKLNGSIKVTSKKEEFTTFDIELPQQQNVDTIDNELQKIKIDLG